MACTTPAANATASGDPTNTHSLRQAFLAEIRRRFRRARGLIRETVGYENDALDLAANADAKDSFEFDSDPGRAEAFYVWLAKTLREEILEPVQPSTLTRAEHWTAEYIRRAYLAGWNQGTGLLFQRGASVRNRDDETIFNLPVPQRQLQRLYTRTFENLQDITEDAADTIRDELTTGLAKGENPRKIARRLTDELRSIQRTRAETLARTEISRSHATATLDRYEDAGVDVVSHGEWSTASDDDVCPVCLALEGVEATTDEMRDTTFEMEGVGYEVRLMPPAHPNCRCVIYPTVGGEPPETPLDERLPDAPAQQAANARVVA